MSWEMIKTEGLTFDYTETDESGQVSSGTRALSDISINVHEGEFIGILGANGSGKSTLARHINALLRPSGGTVWVGGYDTSAEDTIGEIRKLAGMIFQNPENQIVSAVVEEDVAFGPENLGLTSEEIRRRVQNSLASVGMLEEAKRSPDKLSGGQKQRIAIAGVLAMEPGCIVLDESTAMLDPAGRDEILKTIKSLNCSRNVTVIMITHHMKEVTDADRLFVMKKGSVILQGTPEEVFSRGEILRDAGLELPRTLQLAGELKKAGIVLPRTILRPEELAEELVNQLCH